MYHTAINPFKMDETQLLEFAMSGDKQEQYNTGILNQYPVLGSYNKPYDPEYELFKVENDGVEGGKVPDFLQEQEYKKPVFQQQDPVSVLQELNVAEQLDEFRKEDDLLNSINTMFNPVSGNTPEERAKSQTINSLLAEIDNFAKQYRLSKAQVETLKTQVLGNHLGEYINVKNALAKQAKDKQRAEQIAQARGEQPDEQVITGDATVRDENNQLPKGDESDEDGPGGAGGGAGVLDEETEGEDEQPPPGAGGAAAGDFNEYFQGRGEDENETEQARLLISRVLRIDDRTDRDMLEDGIKSHKTTTWRKAFEFMKNRPTTKKDIEFFDKMRFKVVYISEVLNLGRNIDEAELQTALNIIHRAKKLLKDTSGTGRQRASSF